MFEFINKIGFNFWFMFVFSMIILGVLGWFFVCFGNKIVYDEKRNFFFDFLSDIGLVIYVMVLINNGLVLWWVVRVFF